MFDGKQVAVVIPAHNESRLILKAVEAVPVFVDHIIVVDDASTDGTIQVLLKKISSQKVITIEHAQNMGVGGAIVSGYRRALALGVDIVVVMAGDAQMDPKDLPGLLKPLVQGEADYVKGDRLSFTGVFKEMPLSRFVGNHVLSQITRVTSGYREVRDSQCGYTAIGKKALSKLSLDDIYPRYGFPNDILAQLYSINARLSQVPVRPIYAEEVSGISWYTALFRVPLVLMRSFVMRKRRDTKPEFKKSFPES